MLRNKDFIVFFLYSTMVFFSFLYFDIRYMLVSIIIGTMIVLGNYRTILQAKVNNASYILLLFVVSMVLSAPYKIFEQPSSIYFLYGSLVSILMAYLYSFSVLKVHLALKYLVVIVQIFVLLHILYSNDPFPLETLIPGNSSNGITSYLVLLQAVYVFFSLTYGKNKPIITTAITLYICYVGYGRGSLIVAIAMFLYVFFVCFTSFKSRYFKYISFFLVLIIVFSLVYSNWAVFYYFLISKTKLSAGLIDPARLEIYTDYIGKMDFSSFVLGAGFAGTSIDMKYNGNPHSSLIWAHHNFGIFYIMAIFFAFLSMAFVKGSFLISCFTIYLIFIRSLSEPFIFPSLLDFFVFLVFFSAHQTQHQQDSFQNE